MRKREEKSPFPRAWHSGTRELLADEGDWVEIYNRLLVDNHFRVLAIIDIEVKLEFVVYANMNISIGMSYWYKKCKTIRILSEGNGSWLTSDTIDLCEEQYELTAYAMGTLGLKAGVRLTVAVGLLSTRLASVGITAEVGGYAQLVGLSLLRTEVHRIERQNDKSHGSDVSGAWHLSGDQILA